MKRTIYSASALMLLAATLGMTSCSTEDDVAGGGVNGNHTLTLNITPASSLEANDTRATAYSDLTTGTENAINRVAVAVFDTGGKLQGSVYEKTQTSKASSISFEDPNVGKGYKVLVAVNCPAGTFKDVTTAADFKAKTLTIANALYQGGTGNKVSNNNLPMYGEATVAQNGNKNEYTADVFAYHLVSKITLGSLKVDIGSNTFTPTEIFVNNVPDIASVSVVTPHSSYKFATPTAYKTGQTGSASANLLAYLSTGTLSTTNFKGTSANDVTTYNTASQMPVFYTTPNNKTAKGQGNATFLVIKGTYHDAVQNTNSTVYYPLYVNYNTSTQKSADGNTAKTVNPNINYVMNVTIKMKGSSDPYTPVGDNTAKVNVTAVDFDAKTVDYTYDNGVEIGDYLFNDGTYGKLPSASKITSAHHPVAVIFANKTSTIDQKHGWTHGYAIAIASTSGKYRWCNKTTVPTYGSTQFSTQANITKALPSGAKYSDYVSPYNADISWTSCFNTVVQDLDGYTECQALKTAAGTNFTATNYPTVYAALNSFSGIDGFKITGTNTSGWYLGSIGQYYLAYRNLAENLSMWGDKYISGNCFMFTGASNTAYRNKLNNYLSAITKEGTGIAKPSKLADKTTIYFYSASEHKPNTVWMFTMFSDGTVYIDARLEKEYFETAFRPVIAF